MKKLSVIALTLLLVCSALFWLLQHPSPPKLFTDAPADVASPSPADRDLATRLRFVRLNEEVVVKLAQANSEVRLNFFRGDAPTAVIERTEQNLNQSITSYGTLKDTPYSQVILVAGGGTLAGSVMMPDGRMYLISHAQDGVHKILEVANEKLPDCDAGRTETARRSKDGKAVMAFQTVQYRATNISGGASPRGITRVNLRRTNSVPSVATTATATRTAGGAMPSNRVISAKGMNPNGSAQLTLTKHYFPDYASDVMAFQTFERVNLRRPTGTTNASPGTVVRTRPTTKATPATTPVTTTTPPTIPTTPVTTPTVRPTPTVPAKTTNTTTTTPVTVAVTPKKTTTTPAKTTPAKASGTATIDILVVYTTKAAADNGGKSGVENIITTAAAQANTALLNSKINAKIRVVHMAQVSHTEGAGVADDLQSLTDGLIPSFKQVHALRLQYKADLVTLFTAAHGSSSVGVGWLMAGQPSPDNGFNVVEIQAAPMLTFIHETGHNLGCNHTKDGGGSGAFPYSFGHRFKPTDTKAPSADYRTVMAYAPGVRVPYFSNPSVSYYGTATGVTDDADNARTINQTASLIAAYSDTLATQGSATATTQGSDTANRPASGAK